MSDDEREAIKQVTVVIGGGEPFLNRLLQTYLEIDERLSVRPAVVANPGGFTNQVLRAADEEWPVGVIGDPTGEEWEAVADELRLRDSRFGLIVVTARPNYGKQRRWQQEIKPGLNRANGMVSLGSDPQDLADAIIEASDHPDKRSAFWLDEARHPFAFGKTDKGKPASEIRSNPKRHEILALMASGKPQRAIARRFDVAQDSVRDQIKSASRTLGARNDVQLGKLATENGLLDDLDDFDWLD